MPRIYKPDARICNYTIQAEMNRGMMAVAYSALAENGHKVFLKQYKSPTVQVEWYKAYIEYQQQLRQRIDSSYCKRFCYRFLEAFEWERCFFQVFEFLDRSDSLEEVLLKCRKSPKHVKEEQRLIMARVLMYGLGELHEQKIVHSDLKPANIMMVRDETIAAGYKLRVIDMDFSLLQDRQAPWHGHSNYFGTPGYLSPEHLRGQVPQPVSDVFSLGLMLYELLGNGHPYKFDDDARYAEACQRLVAKPIELYGSIEKLVRNPEEIRQTIHRCLSPEPARRPTAKDVNMVLNGGVPEIAPKAGPVGRVTLRSKSNQEVSLNVRTLIGRQLLRRLGDEAKFYDDVQFVLEREPAAWHVVPCKEAKHDTLLNGKRITSRTCLKNGDVLAVGSEQKKIVKLPLTVSF